MVFVGAFTERDWRSDVSFADRTQMFLTFHVLLDDQLKKSSF
jgi:hypothetical protein